ncbi:beta-ribofuranosylaminobenzene 5'-phosphate synthase family protein [Natronorarus salvus]|uniref:beta-ribofuranosylaminobenzene 5'-phosphate synthase family protein n=1 Tax=Natronorarus salvus TaxID=3117733 RepID=UPI002F264C24
MARVTVGARLHFGFQNLSLAHERLYGGVGVALSEPSLSVAADPAEGLSTPDPLAERYARRSLRALDLSGVSVSVERWLPRHVGLGSGTQLALAVYAAVAAAYDREVDVREAAPALGRGGRSGVGVATFESGGFVTDVGHPTTRFTSAPPGEGDWRVPAVLARHDVPERWRFLLVIPEGRGEHGESEDASMRSVVERASPGIGEEIAGILTRRLLPAIAEGDLPTFGRAVSSIGRLNGAWYADEQGGVYRPPVGGIVRALDGSPSVDGAGQSSWGPCVYAVTDSERAEAARAAGERALESANVDGSVRVVRARNEGARIERS